jgi:hypothetical protein
MTNKVIIDLETKEITEFEMDAAELQKEQEVYLAEKSVRDAAAAAKAALLEKLGITEDEAKLLLA